MEQKHYLVTSVIQPLREEHVKKALVELKIWDYNSSHVTVRRELYHHSESGIKLELIVNSEAKRDEIIKLLKEHAPHGMQEGLDAHYSEINVPQRQIPITPTKFYYV